MRACLGHVGMVILTVIAILGAYLLMAQQMPRLDAQGLGLIFVDSADSARQIRPRGMQILGVACDQSTCWVFSR